MFNCRYVAVLAVKGEKCIQFSALRFDQAASWSSTGKSMASSWTRAGLRDASVNHDRTDANSSSGSEAVVKGI
eukprot:5493035-Amphidinium_carterae.1